MECWFIVVNTTSPHCGGINFFYREEEHFTLEALHLRGPNVFSFNLPSGR